MGKKLAIGTEKRAQIVSLSTMNLLEREISRQVKVSKTAIHNTIKKFQNEGTFKDNKRSGHPRISSSRDERVISKVMSQSRMSSAKKIQASLCIKIVQLRISMCSTSFSLNSSTYLEPFIVLSGAENKGQLYSLLA